MKYLSLLNILIIKLYTYNLSNMIFVSDISMTVIIFISSFTHSKEMVLIDLRMRQNKKPLGLQAVNKPSTVSVFLEHMLQKIDDGEDTSVKNRHH